MYTNLLSTIDRSLTTHRRVWFLVGIAIVSLLIFFTLHTWYMTLTFVLSEDPVIASEAKPVVSEQSGGASLRGEAKLQLLDTLHAAQESESALSETERANLVRSVY